MGLVTESFQDALRKGLKAWREARGLRQDDVAGRARSIGLMWNRLTIASIEAGRRDITAEELLLLPIVLRKPVAALMPDDGEMALAGVRVPAEIVRVLLPRGLTVPGEASEYFHDAAPFLEADVEYDLAQRYELTGGEFRAAKASAGEAEERLAERLRSQGLEVSGIEVACAALALWEHDLTTHLDQRRGVTSGGAPPAGAGPQPRRRRTTKKMEEEIAEKIRERRSLE